MFNLSVLISQISSFVYIYITIWWFHSYLSFSLNIHSLSCVLLPLIRQWPQYYSNCDLPYATTTPSRISTYISHLHWLLNCNSLHLNPTTYEAIIISLAYCFYSRPLRHRSHPLLRCFHLDATFSIAQHTWHICTGGFALLPLLWIVNAVWFFREAFIGKEDNEKLRHQFKRCL